MNFNYFKKGFTLIELIIVICIMSIIFSYSLINLGSIGSLENKIDVDVFDNELLCFINRAKVYCREKNVSGYIRFDLNRRNITFNNDIEEISKMDLPEKFNIISSTGNNIIMINSSGVLGDSCSIEFKDRNGNRHCITICVGSFYAEVKF
ncbi:prepilin-type N-terminal cleavage/methylation domain-containing protein [Clostridium algifaecis]|uniref:Prepilin-type N-terminal cleavage/methylation domain-containing protein n=1 Tax=Clostridium algifaecis TaxID=1472040 RepID=A0ABS4KN40_9CLOT|nr:prepilin-type N-terminal cleavage/methylation domain-containing protein [Clostridium algifaecis]MBP2031457.1 prepilin-type N-terminal cleavage/methylation domain-containing protein [Clostridium algifaecis]